MMVLYTAFQVEILVSLSSQARHYSSYTFISLSNTKCASLHTEYWKPWNKVPEKSTMVMSSSQKKLLNIIFEIQFITTHLDRPLCILRILQSWLFHTCQICSAWQVCLQKRILQSVLSVYWKDPVVCSVVRECIGKMLQSVVW